MALNLLLLLSLLNLNIISSLGELQRLGHPIKADGSLSALVIGDWGRTGSYNQTDVAFQMGRIGEKLDIDFIISTGDNFYENGLKGIHDKGFDDSFSSIYTAKSLQKQWYSVLGNHDYRGDVIAQLSPVLRQIDSKWLCMRSFILDAEIVEFFFVDTTPFVMHYWRNPGHSTYDWRDVAPRDTYIANVMKDLESALKESTARWRIVVGHHTIRSVSIHGDTSELDQLLLPILRANNVDLYINGHDHCLQHIGDIDSPIQFLTSGGGSKAWRGVFNSNRDGLQFFYDGQGFMSLQLTQSSVEVVFYNTNGDALHKWSMSKEPLSAI
ncbi:Purple acid phosphatase 17 [Acorus calamus]|uniref:Purple acid phosphatase n=1 Tax=Acorus calamus TaxID=4465 RepID=A0AAV9CK24_ACOCL|nr:Purple acid phosphatase 17 [Acorus calamus]